MLVEAVLPDGSNIPLSYSTGSPSGQGSTCVIQAALNVPDDYKVRRSLGGLQPPALTPMVHPFSIPPPPFPLSLVCFLGVRCLLASFLVFVFVFLCCVCLPLSLCSPVDGCSSSSQALMHLLRGIPWIWWSARCGWWAPPPREEEEEEALLRQVALPPGGNS